MHGLERLTLLGDETQLPSLGPGNVFADLLQASSGRYQSRLEVNHRAESRVIVENAGRIVEKKNLINCPISFKTHTGKDGPRSEVAEQSTALSDDRQSQ